ncbi:MAG: PilZ domain-containing protein [Vicinamibacterales bacterium]|nr:PilZ domain-containing protein [Vicinamibacterales bacterium]
MRTPRPVRVSTSSVAVRLGTELGHVMDISATGALVRMGAPLVVGRECALFLHMPDEPVPLTVRIIRAAIRPVEIPGATSRLRQYFVGVRFTELSPKAKRTVAQLCRGAFAETE